MSKKEETKVEPKKEETKKAGVAALRFKHDGKLYVVYSVRKLECELAIVPVAGLASD